MTDGYGNQQESGLQPLSLLAGHLDVALAAGDLRCGFSGHKSVV